MSLQFLNVPAVDQQSVSSSSQHKKNPPASENSFSVMLCDTREATWLISGCLTDEEDPQLC